jgi:hypothetical protein
VRIKNGKNTQNYTIEHVPVKSVRGLKRMRGVNWIPAVVRLCPASLAYLSAPVETNLAIPIPQRQLDNR